LERAIESISGDGSMPCHEQVVADEVALPREIASELEISHGTVRTRLYRACEQLRTELRPTWEAEMATTDRAVLVNAEIYDVLDKDSGSAVLLRKSGEDRFLPIFVEQSIAHTIRLTCVGAETPRPMIATLAYQMLLAADANIAEVRVDRFADNVFYGTVVLTVGGVEKEIDARPSDALCLAVLASRPIAVAESIFAKAGISAGADIKREGITHPSGMKRERESSAASLQGLIGSGETKEAALEWFRGYVSQEADAG
jgi:bifunctional DNase/RNase